MKTLGPLIWFLFIIGTFALCVVLMLRNAAGHTLWCRPITAISRPGR